MSQKYSSEQKAEINPSDSSLDGEQKRYKTLIICIDRDDDIGRAGLKTPIVGRAPCLEAATRLAIFDPEEADANAIFGAIKQFDELVAKEESCEITIVSGLYDKGVLGDKKIRNQVAEVSKIYKPDGAVLVSDGIEGEELAPVIQGVVPIISIKKIVIKHSGSLEESYAVFGRYLRMLFFDSRYSKYALGVPGAIIVVLTIIAVFNATYALLGLGISLGVVFVVRGFDIDRRIESISKLSTLGFLRLFSGVASGLIIVIGLAAGTATFFPTASGCAAACAIAKEVTSASTFLSHAPGLIGYFLQGSVQFVWLGAGVYIAGTLVFNVLRTTPRHYARYIVELFVLGLLYLPVSLFANDLVAGGLNGNIDVAIILFALAVNFTIAAYLYSVISSRRRGSQAIEV
jgi:putative membrane protein